MESYGSPMESDRTMGGRVKYCTGSLFIAESLVVRILYVGLVHGQ
jgi:hypothetical protein